MALSITSEGTDAAKYLAAKGVTAFVLKYRIAHTGEDATQEFAAVYADKEKYDKTIKKVTPLALADGIAAVAYVRQHASEFGISPEFVGILGFSAGGFIAAEVAVQYPPESRPAFVGVIYGGLRIDTPVQTDAPPMFIAAASDDEVHSQALDLRLVGAATRPDDVDGTAMLVEDHHPAVGHRGVRVTRALKTVERRLETMR